MKKKIPRLRRLHHSFAIYSSWKTQHEYWKMMQKTHKYFTNTSNEYLWQQIENVVLRKHVLMHGDCSLVCWENEKFGFRSCGNMVFPSVSNGIHGDEEKKLYIYEPEGMEQNKFRWNVVLFIDAKAQYQMNNTACMPLYWTPLVAYLQRCGNYDILFLEACESIPST